jgi:hypothetical protein
MRLREYPECLAVGSKDGHGTYGIIATVIGHNESIERVPVASITSLHDLLVVEQHCHVTVCITLPGDLMHVAVLKQFAPVIQINYGRHPSSISHQFQGRLIAGLIDKAVTGICSVKIIE